MNCAPISIAPRNPSVKMPMISAVIPCPSDPANTENISANAVQKSPASYAMSPAILKRDTNLPRI